MRPHIAQSHSPIAVFVCSSDSRRDVLDRVLLPSLLKFWPDCPYPIYVGVNSQGNPLAGGTFISAPASEWYIECIFQLSLIAADYLIVILDDFLIRAPVDQAGLADLVEDVFTLDLAYLRLVPLGRSLPARLTGRRPLELKPGIDRIPPRHPFYSALQITIWRKQHLLSLLEMRPSIWEFEHQYSPGSMHCAINDRPPIDYCHLVERGHWLPYARARLQQAGLPNELGDRPVWPSSRYAALFLDQIRWAVLGYATC